MNGFVKNMKESTIDIAFLPVVTAEKYNTIDVSLSNKKKKEKLNGCDFLRNRNQVPFCCYCIMNYDIIFTLNNNWASIRSAEYTEEI